MLTNTPTSWPEDASYRRIIRELWRQSRYVPPAQPRTAVANAAMSTDEARTASGPERTDSPPWRRGGWVLDVNDRGDVVFRHDSGHEVVVAALPEEGNGDG